MLRELFVVVGVVGVALSMLMVGAGQGRKSAGLAGSLANLKKIGEGTGMYAGDSDDELWSFWWEPGNYTTSYEDLQNPFSSADAVMYQATDIVRRLYHRDDIPKLDDRLPCYWLSSLVLADYLQEPLPAEWMVSPGDAVRLGWQADPDNPADLNEQGGAAWNTIFGVFGSSYALMPAFFAPDEKVGTQQTIYQNSGNHKLTFVPGGISFGGRHGSEVLYPSQKVHMAESASFFVGLRPVYYLHQQARVPVLTADGAATPRSSADANASFRPNSPENLLLTSTTDYRPNPIYDPPTISGGTTDVDLETHYKWTRRGLRGIDFGGERAE